MFSTTAPIIKFLNLWKTSPNFLWGRAQSSCRRFLRWKSSIGQCGFRFRITLLNFQQAMCQHDNKSAGFENLPPQIDALLPFTSDPSKKYQHRTCRTIRGSEAPRSRHLLQQQGATGVKWLRLMWNTPDRRTERRHVWVASVWFCMFLGQFICPALYQLQFPWCFASCNVLISAWFIQIQTGTNVKTGNMMTQLLTAKCWLSNWRCGWLWN